MNIQYNGLKPKDFYVYIHRKATTGEIFYVGKGSGSRYKTHNNRSNYWLRIAKKYGIKIEIVQDGLQEWYAYELEEELVNYYGRRDENFGTLINLCDGGGNVRNYNHTEEFKNKIGRVFSYSNIDNTRYHLINDLTGEEFHGLRKEFTEKYGISLNSIFRNNTDKVVKNWRLKDSIITRSKSNGMTDVKITIYKFIHKNGNQFIGTREEFTNEYNLNMNRLFMSKPRNSLYGWKVEKV